MTFSIHSLKTIDTIRLPLQKPFYLENIMLLNIISISFGQEIGERLEISKEAKGIECLFTEPFITFRYHFEDQLITQNGMDISVGIHTSSLTRKETQNPFSAEYHIKLQDLLYFSDSK